MLTIFILYRVQIPYSYYLLQINKITRLGSQVHCNVTEVIRSLFPVQKKINQINKTGTITDTQKKILSEPAG